MRVVPFGRAIVVLQLIAALTFLGYTAGKKGVQIPLVSDAPFEIDVLMPDAQGLLPAKEPAVGVAGAPAGKVTRVRVEDGRARVTLRVDGEFKGKIFRDASATVRPTSALMTLIVNIDPGTRSSGVMEPGGTIGPARTSAFVHIDELTETLDVDTQAQIQVLVRELARGLDGREPELRRVIAELGRLTDSATPLARALDDRRVLLRRLVDNLDVMLRTLGDRGEQLAGAVTLGNRTLEVTARRGADLEAALREIAPAVVEAREALAATRRLAAPLAPALDRLMPVASQARPVARRLRAVLPALDRFVATAGQVTEHGRRPARLLADGLEGQSELIENDQKPALQELIGLVELLERNRNGVIQFARNISGATSVNRRAGTYAQFDIMNFETSPAAFGLGPSAARSRGGKPSLLARGLSEMLERTCRDGNAAACIIRFQIPGLPATPVLTPEKPEGD